MLRSLHRPALALALTGVTALAACSDDTTGPAAPGSAAASSAAGTGEFVILGSGWSLPADLEAQVAAAGGTLRQVFPEIGVAVAESPDPAFAARAAAISGVESAAPDVVLQWTRERRVTELAAGDAVPFAAAQVASRADDEPFYAYQWAPAAVQAPEAWNAGLTGRGVRVAVVDGGLYAAHADLRANVDVAASRSFVPGTAFNQDLGTFWHGTHVAGIVGAADNGVGVIGIAPEATLIGVKVLHGGSGAFSWIIDGIMYAARPQSEGGAGAQVINMSLGGAFDGKDKATKAAVQELAKAVDRATRYAYQQGATLIAAAGNDGISFDAEKTLVDFPAQSANVISVSATGPLAWAYGATDFSRPASYTSYGKSLVTLAAPGGDFAYAGNESCNLSGFTSSCWVFDMYLSTSRGSTAAGSYSWSAGTSMASPVAAGIAALVIQANGGRMAPAQVEARLRQGAVDLGKPGKDEFYGHGFVNALRSVQ
jgi:subtilisin family serine protease